jgi:hypothetical protein
MFELSVNKLWNAKVGKHKKKKHFQLLTSTLNAGIFSRVWYARGRCW